MTMITIPWVVAMIPLAFGLQFLIAAATGNLYMAGRRGSGDLIASIHTVGGRLLLLAIAICLFVLTFLMVRGHFRD